MASSSSVGTNSGDQQQTATANITKNDKPKVELFVMSYCPYGTQIEKGIIPAVQALGNKIDFNLKFVDYAMHGQQELNENLKEYCIDKNQKDKLLPYLTCFLKSSDSAACLKSAGVNQSKLDSCVKSADKEFKVTEQFTSKENWNGSYPPFDVHKADNTKYGVQGSPTLVINGTSAESARDSASLLKTICSAFNNQPDVCSTAKLSSASPSAGFGEGTEASSGSTAGCAE
jgi:protein-disulfide isomerase